ncbi:MAG TPA: DUF2325 domain-containing protein, partial [Chromatiaceae bacterium]|nr:DUF2325 domain-containing protein [Chromatiaceae bacterium]
MIAMTERKTYWQIDGILNCPVVGTCLSFAEQKKLLKKTGVPVANLTDHEIHHALVQSGRDENSLSRRIQRMLEGKYKREIGKIGMCDEEVFLELWRMGLRRGEIDALLWIGASNPNISSTAVTQIFGDYHMHTHGQGAIIRRQLQQLEKQKQKNKQLSETLKQARKQKQTAVQKLNLSERDRLALQQKADALQRKNEAYRNRPKRQLLQEANGAMEDQIRNLENKLQAQSELIAELKRENDRLTHNLAEQEKINNMLRLEFNWLTQPENDPACATCPQRDSCPCRVLIVGGLNTLRPHYQNLVEQGGGEFRHHDSRSGSSERVMRPMIGWADVILCPID